MTTTENETALDYHFEPAHGFAYCVYDETEAALGVVHRNMYGDWQFWVPETGGIGWRLVGEGASRQAAIAASWKPA